MELLLNSLVTYFLFMAVATSFIPLPDFPMILHLAALGTYPPWLIALIGGIGTCAAGLIDYIIVTQLRRLERVERLLQHRYYTAFERAFKRVAFLSIVASGFLVFIPFDPFKLLAATARYDKYRYIAAIFIGRAPRYYLFALFGSQYSIGPPVLLAIFLVLAAIPALQYLHRRYRKSRRAGGDRREGEAIDDHSRSAPAGGKG